MSQSICHPYEISLSPQPLAVPVTPPQIVTVARASRPAPRALAGRGDRLVAVVLDAILVALPILAILCLRRGVSQAVLGGAHLRLGLIALVPCLVVLQWLLLSLRGQTLGKMAMGLRIVREEDCGNPGFLRAVLMRLFVPRLIKLVPVLGTLFGLADVLSIFGEERRCIHDRIAGTKVVEA
jgi:uncharacterized RDD family membrane protein YckC